MGGSGGSFFRGTSKPEPDKISRQIQRSVDKTETQEFELALNQLFGDQLSVINDRDYQDTQEKLNKIEDLIDSEIDGTVNIKFGGSVAKHTYVDGLSDIDSLVFLNNSDLKNKTPEEVKEYFFQKVKEAFPNEAVKKGDLAVTVDFKNGTEIQLLPAVKFKTGLKIAANSKEWSNIIKPDTFAKLLRRTNMRVKGKLLPVVKLAKKIVAKLPENLRLTGYHTEAIAIQSFYDYKGEMDHKSMLKHFFDSASNIVLKSIKDKTGQSVHVDDYLGTNNSLRRKIISNRLDQIKRQMKNAELMNSSNYWKEILD